MSQWFIEDDKVNTDGINQIFFFFKEILTLDMNWSLCHQ